MTTRYVHTNIVAKDWRKLANFYEIVFGCRPVPPQRDLSGRWLDRATGLSGARIQGVHLRLPGYGAHGPTLEIFEYDHMPSHPRTAANIPGYTHIAFAVDDVAAVANTIIENGGVAVGAFTERSVPDLGRLTFQYLTDPEGNMIEIQSWDKQE